MDGINGASGSIVLGLTLSTATVTRPPNDDFENRISVSGSSVATSGSNINATRQLGEPIHAGQYGGTSVWWTWTVPAAGMYRIRTDQRQCDFY